MGAAKYKAGDWVIVRKQKHSDSPGPRARHTTPASKGDSYAYLVDKFWIVDEVLADGELKLRTRRGKVHLIAANAPHVRKPNWLERILYGPRFRAVEQGT